LAHKKIKQGIVVLILRRKSLGGRPKSGKGAKHNSPVGKALERDITIERGKSR
jgi:hypothetical protein